MFMLLNVMCNKKSSTEIIITPPPSSTAVVLNADGPGNTYELINSKLTPGFEAVENPECVHSSFGRHIAEVWDADLTTEDDYIGTVNIVLKDLVVSCCCVCLIC